MKRSTIVALGTVAGVAGVLGLNPDSPSLTASSATTTAIDTSATTTSATPAATASASASAKATTAAKATAAATPTATAAAASGSTITGKAYAAARYGNLQLQATVSGGKITAITAVAYPANDGRSMMISQSAIPMLTKEALAAQSASINGISGATFTSNAYAQSLQSILDQMK